MRNKKISADISKEANTMLNEYCVKHERSKGFLLEKMIRRYCAEIEVTIPVVKAPSVDKVIKKNTVKKFNPPTVDEVREYCDSRCNNVDASDFVNHYTANGWMRGKNKVKCWKSCVHTWENKDKPQKAVNESLGGKW